MIIVDTCGSNRLYSLDVSSCVNLININCNNNQLSIIGFTNKVKFANLFCNDTVTVIEYNK